MTPSQRCFDNFLIMQKILNFIHPADYLELRLVNKIFNAECMNQLRKTHNKMIIKFHDARLEDGIGTIWIDVNDHVITLDLIRKYFKFLVDVVGVRVRELRTKELYLLGEEEYRNQMHDDILEVLIKNQKLKVFTGMEEVCPEGCTECERHALESREYNPMQLKVLLNGFNDRKKHFETLSVSDSLLAKIGFRSILSDDGHHQPHDVAITLMQSMITPNITCDRLNLILNEECHITFSELPADYRHPHPRTIIEQMCKVWRVKSIRIEVHGCPKTYFIAYHWAPDEYFGSFRLNDAYEDTAVSTGLHFDHVEIHLDYFRLAYGDVFRRKTESTNYDNMIANVVRMFPTEHISVNCDERDWAESFDETLLEGTIGTVWKDENQRNLETTIRFKTFIDSHTEPFDFPEKFTFMGRELECEVSESTITDSYMERPQNGSKIDCFRIELIGKTFTIRDEATNCVLNLEVLVVKKQLESVMEKTEVDGFLRRNVVVDRNRRNA